MVEALHRDEQSRSEIFRKLVTAQLLETYFIPGVAVLPVSNRSASMKRLYRAGVSTFYVSERSEFRMWPGR